MPRAIVTVLLVLVLIAYGALFVSWNQQTVGLVALGPPAQTWIQDLPLGFAVLGAILGGAILMALFVGAGWAAQRSAQLQAQRQVDAARKKLSELVAKVKQQRTTIADLEQRLAQATSSPPQDLPAAPVVKLPTAAAPLAAASTAETEAPADADEESI